MKFNNFLKGWSKRLNNLIIHFFHSPYQLLKLCAPRRRFSGGARVYFLFFRHACRCTKSKYLVWGIIEVDECSQTVSTDQLVPTILVFVCHWRDNACLFWSISKNLRRQSDSSGISELTAKDLLIKCLCFSSKPGDVVRPRTSLLLIWVWTYLAAFLLFIKSWRSLTQALIVFVVRPLPFHRPFVSFLIS